MKEQNKERESEAPKIDMEYQYDGAEYYQDVNPEISYGAFGAIILAIFTVTMAVVFWALAKP